MGCATSKPNVGGGGEGPGQQQPKQPKQPKQQLQQPASPLLPQPEVDADAVHLQDTEPSAPATSATSTTAAASAAASGGEGAGAAGMTPPIMQRPQRDSIGSDCAPSQFGSSPQPASSWDKARMMFVLTKPEDLLGDLHDLKYIGAGGYGKVFKAAWRSAPVAVKLVPSNSPELFKSSSYKEALLCKELCHPNIVQTYETRCAQLTEEFIRAIIDAAEPSQNGNGETSNSLQPIGSRDFVSGDGFGLPSPVPDMVVRGKALPGAAAKWKDILLTTGTKAGDYLTVIIMDFCDYGSLVRPILKGMFRPVSASGNDREARVRYRALLRTAKEIAQGIEHLHHLRVVHGDLKPGNVLLKGSRVDVRGFNAQVIDFGLSHLVSNSNPQKVSKAGGTLVYAAPEVFSGVVGKAADIYSLGIILWEMATGSQPYKDLVEGQIVVGVQKNGLRPLWPAGQLPQLQELYEKCVAQDAEARPKAKELVQRLTQIEMDLRAQLKLAHQAQQEQQQQLQLQQQQQQQLQQSPPKQQQPPQQQPPPPQQPQLQQKQEPPPANNKGPPPTAQQELAQRMQEARMDAHRAQQEGMLRLRASQEQQ